jgi:anti-anti-sigma factor
MVGSRIPAVLGCGPQLRRGSIRSSTVGALQSQASAERVQTGDTSGQVRIDGRTPVGSPGQNGRLVIEAIDGEEELVIRLIGEFDMENRKVVEAAIARGVCSDARRVLVDLRGLDFISSIGMTVLVDANRRDSVYGKLVFVSPTGPVADLFRLTGLDDALPFVDHE